MGYLYKNPADRCQVPELGTPSPGPRPKRQRRSLAWFESAEEDSKAVIESVDIVALLLVEGTLEAMNRTWSKLKVSAGWIRERLLSEPRPAPGVDHALVTGSRVEVNRKIVVWSADIVALLLLAGTGTAINRALSEVQVMLRSTSEPFRQRASASNRESSRGGRTSLGT